MRILDSALERLSLSRELVVPATSLTGATLANSLMGFVVNVIAARTLGAEGFGVFSLAFSVATMTGTIGDYGFNLTVIRLFNKYQREPETQNMVLGVALAFKSLLFAFLAITSLHLGGFLALSLGTGIIESELFSIALITGGLLFFWTYLQSYLQSYRSFGQLAAYIFGYAALRAVCLGLALAFFPKNPQAWILATYTIPVAVLIIWGLIPRRMNAMCIALRKPNVGFEILKEMLDYSKWVALSTIAYAAMPYMARFILAMYSSVAEVGIFSAGMTFTMAFTTLNTAMRAIVFPQVTAFEGKEQINRYIARLKTIAPYYSVAAIAGIIVLGFMQWVVLGGEYRDALPVFLVTGGAFAVVLFLGLGTMLVHTMMKPEIDAWTNVGRLCLMIILSLLLVPTYGSLGESVAYVVPLLIGEILMFLYVIKRSGRCL